MEWFRLYSNIINDPKIMNMPEKYRWRYIALLCLFRINSDSFPIQSEILFSMRIKKQEWELTKNEFIKRGLIVNDTINGWTTRQYKSDNGYERVKRFRNVSETFLKRNRNVSETAPDTDTETSLIKNKNGVKESIDKTMTISSLDKSRENKKSLEYLDQNINQFDVEEFKNIDIDKEYKKFCDWLKSKGKQYKDYSAGFRNWLRSDFVSKTNQLSEKIINQINIPKSFAGWEKTEEIKKDNLEHDIYQYKRFNIDQEQITWYCPICDKQFTG